MIDCIAVAKYSRGIIVDQNNEPISNVKIYEDSIESEERSISNAQGEFEIPHGVCGEIALQVVTPDGGIYTRKYDSEHIPKVIKMEYKVRRIILNQCKSEYVKSKLIIF